MGHVYVPPQRSVYTQSANWKHLAWSKALLLSSNLTIETPVLLNTLLRLLEEWPAFIPVFLSHCFNSVYVVVIPDSKKFHIEKARQVYALSSHSQFCPLSQPAHFGDHQDGRKTETHILTHTQTPHTHAKSCFV